ncbi:MAG: transcriptional regulator [Gammaproteobacteria bacterium HGW-Gammaproteobacteria-8]|nr:MAG: transcriptional regulator [Gammaproteobacteria bacterium HGW-Gammaproteobacteria-8]
MSVTSVRLQPELEQELAELADRTKRSKGWLINEALAEYIARQRLEQDRWQQTLNAIDAAARGELVQGEAVIDWLGRWGSQDESEPPAPRR